MHTDRMKNWGKHFGLVELRKVRISEVDLLERLYSEDFIKLTDETSMDAERFAALPAWDKATAKAAAVALTVDRAVISGRAAARLQEIEILGTDPLVDLQLLDGKKPVAKRFWPAGVIYRSTYLPATQITEEHGMRTTRILRTVADIARFHGVLDGVVALDSVRRRWPGLTLEQLETGLLGKFSYRGISRVREALHLSIPNSGSVPETLARFLLLRAGLPEIRSIQPQARIHYGPYGQYFEVDLLINGWLIIEIDGEVKYDDETYGKVAEIIKDERDREKILQNLGYVVVRVGYRHMSSRADGSCEFLDLVSARLNSSPDRLPVRESAAG